MRHINEQFTESEWRRLKESKGNRTWREAMLEDIAGVSVGDGE